MKKLLTLVIAVILGMGALFANPVDVNTAKALGHKFVQTNFEKTMRADLQLYYTVTSVNGEPCAYVFNMGDEGFVIVAASDNVRPILAYSENGSFDASNPYNGAMYMLETYKNSISYAIEKNIPATPEIASQWETLRDYGRLSNKRGNSVGPLVQTKWNQNSPYNLYAPAAAGGPGGRCYAGCVATAMSQVMRYWNHPTQGSGSHSYYCPGYGQQSANFGATTYHWELMPLTLDGASQEQIEAVAKLMYHCAVAVDMSFAPDGSGAQSQDVPPAMAQYFDYDNCVQRQRSSYSLVNWVNLLKAEFDLGRPVYYSGYDYSTTPPGGHAFVADGYDEDDFIHFNFGWSGSDDDWYQVDAIDYATYASAIFNYVPTDVYNNTVQAPTNVTATKTSDVAQEATITWTNPNKTVNNQTLTTLDQIVVTRNGKVIYTVDNVNAGQSMSYVDQDVPCYSTFEYKVFAVKDGINGIAGKASESFGPTCNWTIIGQTTNMAGWKGGYLIAYDGAGNEIDRVTMTSSNPLTFTLPVAPGRVYFRWLSGTDNVSLTIKIKDASNTAVYQYNGSSNDIPEGRLFEGSNNCGNTPMADAPSDLRAYDTDDNVVLTWSGSMKTDYGYNIYRDGYLIKLAHETEFVDENPGRGGHCYQVCYLTDGGESPLGNEACANTGEGCDPATDLWYEVQDNFKPILHWTAPENSEGLSGYVVYRKDGDDANYEKLKSLGASKLEYKETKTLEENVWYSYKIVAAYRSIDCEAAPAKNRYDYSFCVRYYYSLDGIGEDMAQIVSVYPNPAKDNITVKADNLSNVVIYNSLGQKVYEQALDGDQVVVNTNNFDAGIYMLRIVANGNEITRKISVVK